MKKGIHPEYPTMTVRLADGTIFQTRSTMGIEQYNTEVDSSNHPFYTGKKTIVDTAGRIDKFNRRYATKKADAPAADAGEGAEAEG